jgi:hypothetical protein
MGSPLASSRIWAACAFIGQCWASVTEPVLVVADAPRDPVDRAQKRQLLAEAAW